jgi:hypothetical protein
MRIRDGKYSDPRCGAEKSWIRDKHTGSATLLMLPPAPFHVAQLVLSLLVTAVNSSVVNPRLFQWIRISFLPQCGSGSTSQINAGQCGSKSWSDLPVTKSLMLTQ